MTEIYNQIVQFEQWVAKDRVKYDKKFKTWQDAEEIYNIIFYYEDSKPTFEEWAEENEIIILEAQELEDSDRYDLATAHTN